MTADDQRYRIPPGRIPGRLPLIIGVVALLVSVLGYLDDSPRFYHAYLTAFAFWVTISLGALFFVMLQHLTAARWSVVVRRLVESIMMSLPVLAVFFIPIAFGLNDLYAWSRPEVVAGDLLLTHKAPYLNTAFFLLRALLYFAVWFFLASFLYRNSLADDSGYDEARRIRVRRLSAGGMILFAFTTTFAAFDWLMSLDAHWYSTIFGVYVFAGGVVGGLCVTTLAALHLRRRGILADVITVEHYDDLGKLTFAFLVFWGYMAFSQYFLIWYANIPEETIWFAHRWVGSWKAVSLALVFGNFGIPFLVLMPKAAKRSLPFMAVMSVWLLAAHWVDMYWLILPSLNHHGAHFSWLDPVLTVGIGGVLIGLFWRRFAAHPIVPIGDPQLEASIRFINR